MPQSSKKVKRIDQLLKDAATSLSREAVFEAERMGNKALGMSRQSGDFERMAEALALLADIRRTRLDQALAVKSVTVVDAPITDAMHIEPGCYLVEPPQVGADARRLRLAAFQKEVPVAVVCREPLTKTGLCPIVAIGVGGTIRTKVKPPRKPEMPSMRWFIDAMETLGNWAIEMIDPEVALTRRIDTLFDRLDAIPDHIRLHAATEAACREAAEMEASLPANSKRDCSGDSGASEKSHISP